MKHHQISERLCIVGSQEQGELIEKTRRGMFEAFPIVCGLSLADYKRHFNSYSIHVANGQQCVNDAAHLYIMVKSFHHGNVAKDVPVVKWPEMEEYLRMHASQHFGERTEYDLRTFTDRWKLHLTCSGVSVAWIQDSLGRNRDAPPLNRGRMRRAEYTTPIMDHFCLNRGGWLNGVDLDGLSRILQQKLPADDYWAKMVEAEKEANGEESNVQDKALSKKTDQQFTQHFSTSEPGKKAHSESISDDRETKRSQALRNLRAKSARWESDSDEDDLDRRITPRNSKDKTFFMTGSDPKGSEKPGEDVPLAIELLRAFRDEIKKEEMATHFDYQAFHDQCFKYLSDIRARLSQSDCFPQEVYGETILGPSVEGYMGVPRVADKVFDILDRCAGDPRFKLNLWLVELGRTTAEVSQKESGKEVLGSDGTEKGDTEMENTEVEDQAEKEDQTENKDPNKKKNQKKKREQRKKKNRLAKEGAGKGEEVDDGAGPVGEEEVSD